MGLTSKGACEERRERCVCVLDVLAERSDRKWRLVGPKNHVPPHEKMPKVEDEALVVHLHVCITACEYHEHIRILTTQSHAHICTPENLSDGGVHGRLICQHMPNTRHNTHHRTVMTNATHIPTHKKHKTNTRAIECSRQSQYTLKAHTNTH